jgi:hypothetical protein
VDAACRQAQQEIEAAGGQGRRTKLTERSEEDQIVINQVGARIFQMIRHYKRFVKDTPMDPRLEWYLAEDLARCRFIRSSVEMRRAESEE